MTKSDGRQIACHEAMLRPSQQGIKTSEHNLKLYIEVMEELKLLTRSEASVCFYGNWGSIGTKLAVVFSFVANYLPFLLINGLNWLINIREMLLILFS